jgi:rubrerythrin
MLFHVTRVCFVGFLCRFFCLPQKEQNPATLLGTRMVLGIDGIDIASLYIWSSVQPGQRAASFLEIVTMDSVETFLAYSIRLEEDAALRFDQLADAMQTGGNAEVAKLFRQLAEYSRLHAKEARARSGARDIPKLSPIEFEWPDIESPETAAIWAIDPFIGREEALQVALNAERASLAYYKEILAATQDPEVRAFAEEFVKEESQHVAELERWLTLHRARKPLPVDP